MVHAADDALTHMLHTQMPYTAQLGLRAVSADRVRVVAVADWREDRCTSGHVLHGGFLMAIADTVGATCAVYNLPEGASTATIESKTNLFRPVTGGTVTATATPVHVGRTTIVVQTDVVRDDGKLASRTTQTQSIVMP